MIKSPFMAALLLMIAPPVFAGQADDDIAALDACLAAATPWKEANVCIGIVNRPCQATGNYSTQEMVECFSREQAAWEAILDEALRELHIKSAEIDAINDKRQNRPTLDASLTSAQAAWIDFRKVQCFYESHPSTGGSILRLYGAACWMRMTAERAIHLDRNVRHGN